jgi:hypothetical protein
MRNLCTLTLGAVGLIVATNFAFASNDCRLEGYWLSKNPNEKITFGMIKSGENESDFQWRVDEYITEGKYALSPSGDQIHFIGMTKDTHSGFQKRFDTTFAITMSRGDVPVLFTLKGDNPTVDPQDFHRNSSDPTDTALIESLCNP